MIKTLFEFMTKLFKLVKQEPVKPSEVSKQQIDDAQAAERLYDVLKAAVQLPQYQRGFLKDNKGNPCTFCNVLARDLLDSACPKAWIMGWLIGGTDGTVRNGYDYDISAINPGADLLTVINNTLPGKAYRNLLATSKTGMVTEVTPEEAQALANKGIPVHVISEKWGHECIVAPDFKNSYQAGRGALIGQAGWYNGIFYISDKQAFGDAFDDPEIKYYKYPLRKSV